MTARLLRAALAALLVLSGPAAATASLDVSVSPAVAGRYADFSLSASLGTSGASGGTTTRFAAGTTFLGAVPAQHGDAVGAVGTAYDLWTNGCNGGDSQTFTLTLVSPMGSGAPAGAVAELRVQGSFLGLTVTRRAFLSYANGAYELHLDQLVDSSLTCSAGTQDLRLTVYGYARMGGVTTVRTFHRNPSTAGTHTAYLTYSGGTLSDTYLLA